MESRLCSLLGYQHIYFAGRVNGATLTLPPQTPKQFGLGRMLARAAQVEATEVSPGTAWTKGDKQDRYHVVSGSFGSALVQSLFQSRTSTGRTARLLSWSLESCRIM